MIDLGAVGRGRGFQPAIIEVDVPGAIGEVGRQGKEQCGTKSSGVGESVGTPWWGAVREFVWRTPGKGVSVCVCVCPGCGRTRQVGNNRGSCESLGRAGLTFI